MTSQVRRVGKGALRRAHHLSVPSRDMVGTLSLCPPYRFLAALRGGERVFEGIGAIYLLALLIALFINATS